jgi:hypothetical protein
MEEILASIRRIIADDDALPLMRRPAPSLVTREPAAAAPRHPSASTPSAPPVHLVALTSGEAAPAESAGEPPTIATHADPLGTGLEYSTEHRAAEEPGLRPSIRDEMAEAEDTPIVAASARESRGEVSSPLALDRQDRNNAALVSPSTDASVASSFQSLATSMFLRDSDLIARTAREMLRPMLKQWLDDNLPVMVERLVRAEIERVARGGR